MSAAAATREDGSYFVEQGISPLCSEGAPPDADPDYLYLADHVERVALVDHSLGEPTEPIAYFTPTRRLVRRGNGGRRRLLKKPREYVVPGAQPGTIGWLDFHPCGDDTLCIDYMTTRRDLRHMGIAVRLARLFYERVVVPRGIVSVDCGRVKDAHAWQIMERMKKELPAIECYGKRQFQF